MRLAKKRASESVGSVCKRRSGGADSKRWAQTPQPPVRKLLRPMPRAADLHGQSLPLNNRPVKGAKSATANDNLSPIGATIKTRSESATNETSSPRTIEWTVTETRAAEFRSSDHSGLSQVYLPCTAPSGLPCSRGLARVTPHARGQFALTQASEQTRKILRQHLGRNVVARRAQDGSELGEQIKLTILALRFVFAHVSSPLANNALGSAMFRKRPALSRRHCLGQRSCPMPPIGAAGGGSCIGASAEIWAACSRRR